MYKLSRTLYLHVREEDKIGTGGSSRKVEQLQQTAPPPPPKNKIIK